MAPFRDDDDEKPMTRLLQRLVEAREARSLFGDTTSQLWLDAEMEADLFLAKYGRSCAEPVRIRPTPARGPAISWYCGPAELSPHVDGLSSAERLGRLFPLQTTACRARCSRRTAGPSGQVWTGRHGRTARSQMCPWGFPRMQRGCRRCACRPDRDAAQSAVKLRCAASVLRCPTPAHPTRTLRPPLPALPSPPSPDGRRGAARQYRMRAGSAPLGPATRASSACIARNVACPPTPRPALSTPRRAPSPAALGEPPLAGPAPPPPPPPPRGRVAAARRPPAPRRASTRRCPPGAHAASRRAGACACARARQERASEGAWEERAGHARAGERRLMRVIREQPHVREERPRCARAAPRRLAGRAARRHRALHR